MTEIKEETKIPTLPVESKPKKKKRSYIWIFWLTCIIFGILFINNIYLDNQNKEDYLNFTEADCESVYLGHCLDLHSDFYRCNLAREDCNATSWNLIRIIGLLEINNIQIFGKSTSIVCQKQLEEFGDYVDYVKLKGIYINCDESRLECTDVKIYPTWKQGGKIILEEYMPLDRINFG